MEKSHDNPRSIATIFIENSEEILRIYCRFNTNLKLINFSLLTFQILSEYGDSPACPEGFGWESFPNTVLSKRPGTSASTVIIPSQASSKTDQIPVNFKTAFRILSR